MEGKVEKRIWRGISNAHYRLLEKVVWKPVTAALTKIYT